VKMVLHTPAQVLFAHLQRRQIERLIAQATDAQKELRADLLRTRRELDLMIHQVGVAVKESAKMPRIGPARRLPRAPLRATRIQTPPGARLARCATFLLTKDAYRRYVQPVIADMQFEYCEALAAGATGRARWIAVRGWFLVVPGWVVGLAGRIVRWMFSA